MTDQPIDEEYDEPIPQVPYGMKPEEGESEEDSSSFPQEESEELEEERTPDEKEEELEEEQEKEHEKKKEKSKFQKLLEKLKEMFAATEEEQELEEQLRKEREQERDTPSKEPSSEFDGMLNQKGVEADPLVGLDHHEAHEITQMTMDPTTRDQLKEAARGLREGGVGDFVPTEEKELGHTVHNSTPGEAARAVEQNRNEAWQQGKDHLPGHDQTGG